MSPGRVSFSPTRFNRRWVLSMPEVLGPIRRIPWRRAVAVIPSSSRRPSRPSSPNPPAMITAPVTPLRPQSSRMASMVAAGVVMSTRSTGPGMADTLG